MSENRLITRLRAFLAPPVFPDDEDRQRHARLLHTLLVSAALIAIFIAFFAIPFLFVEKLFNTIAILCLLAVILVAYLWMRAGRVRLAAAVFTAAMWLAFTLFLLFSGGTTSVIVVFYLLNTVITGMLLGTRAALIHAFACIFAGLAMVILDHRGALPSPLFLPSPLVAWFDLTIALLATSIVVSLSISSLKASLSHTRQQIEEHELVESTIALQVERLKALNNIEQAVLGSMQLDRILELLVRQVVHQLHVDAADVLLYNSQAATLDFASGEGFLTQALRYTHLPVGDGLAGLAARDQRTIYIADLTALQDNPRLTRAISNEKFITYFAIPLIANQQLHGVMEIFHRSSLAPDPDWLTFLDTLAGQAAISIDHARLLDETQQSLKEANALYLTTQELAASSDPTQLMNAVVEHLHEHFGYHYVQIFVRDPETDDFLLRAGSGPTGLELIRRGHRLAAGEGIIGHTAETGLPFFTNNVEDVIFFKPNLLLPGIRSELTVPIKTGEHILGHLDVQQVPPAQFSHRDLRLVGAVAEQLAVALQKARLYADLQGSLDQEKKTRAQLVHSEKLAVAGRLLASVSHELNNPLQAIQNVLYLLQEDKRLSPQSQQDLKIVLSEAERMAVMLARLRTTYQPVRTAEFQPVQLHDILADVSALVSTHLRHAGITYQFHPDPGLPQISGLPDQLRQVFLNLFMNAVDAMPGGGTLLVTSHHLAENNEVLISIADDGPGIDPLILPHVFEPFTTDKDQGTGLGLAITYEAVFNHGGRIQAENNPGRGATFSVWLPVGMGA